MAFDGLLPARRSLSVAGMLLLLAAAGLLGCTQMSINQLLLGYYVRDPSRVFPEGRSRRTDLGLCYLNTDVLGQTEAVVVLLTREQRIAGKFHARSAETNYGFRVDASYSLRGELDPNVAALAGTGPLDSLRAIADDLTLDVDDPLVREAQAWVAAGIVRLIQQWPHVGDEGPAAVRLTEMLERVPRGGESTITIRPDGTHVIEYSRTVSR